MIKDTTQFCDELESLLRPYGTTQQVYITAELAPFSSQKKPNIIFYPNEWSRSRAIFIDYMFEFYSGTESSIRAKLRSRLEFVLDDSEVELNYVLASNDPISDCISEISKIYHVQVIDKVNSPREIMKFILKQIQN